MKTDRFLENGCKLSREVAKDRPWLMVLRLNGTFLDIKLSVSQLSFVP